MCPMDVHAAQLCEAPQKLATLSSVLQFASHLPRKMVRHAGNCLHLHRPDQPRMLEFGSRCQCKYQRRKCAYQQKVCKFLPIEKGWWNAGGQGVVGQIDMDQLWQHAQAGWYGPLNIVACRTPVVNKP